MAICGGKRGATTLPRKIVRWERALGKVGQELQCSLANANSVKAKFRITRILTTSPCIAPIKTCTIKVLLSRIPLNKKFCLTSTSLVEPFVL